MIKSYITYNYVIEKEKTMATAVSVDLFRVTDGPEKLDTYKEDLYVIALESNGCKSALKKAVRAVSDYSGLSKRTVHRLVFERASATDLKCIGEVCTVCSLIFNHRKGLPLPCEINGCECPIPVTDHDLAK